MHSQILYLLTISIATVASGLPTALESRQAADWVANSAGNLRITCKACLFLLNFHPNPTNTSVVSDATVQLGTLDLSTIISKFGGACIDAGVCDTSPISLTGYQLITAGDGTVNDETVTVTPAGAYQSWIHNGLLDALQAAAVAVAQCESVTITPTCDDSPYYCPSQPSTVTECTVPQFWGVNYQDSSDITAAPSYMELTLDVQVDTGSGFCSTFATVGGAVAGAVNGVAGGLFSLFGLACQ